MVDFFSDHWTSTVSKTSIDRPKVKTPGGVSGAPILYKRASFTMPTTVATTEIIRLFPVKSNIRVLELLTSHTADASTTLDANVGLALASTLGSVNSNYVGSDRGASSSGGAVFASFVDSPFNDITATLSRVDTLISNPWTGAGNGESRGKQLWEAVNFTINFAGGTVFPYDPRETWDVVMTPITVAGVVASEYVVEMYYVEDK